MENTSRSGSPIRGKDFPPVWAAFPIAALYCGEGWISGLLRHTVNGVVRIVWGRNSMVRAKLRMTCVTRRVVGYLAGARPGGGEAPEDAAARELAQALELFEDGQLGPVWSLEGKLQLFHRHPPNPEGALRAYEQAAMRLGTSPYLAVLAKPEHVFFGAAMSATLLGNAIKAGDFLERYKAFVALHPKKSWGVEAEQDLEKRILRLS